MKRKKLTKKSTKTKKRMKRTTIRSTTKRTTKKTRKASTKSRAEAVITLRGPATLHFLPSEEIVSVQSLGSSSLMPGYTQVLVTVKQRRGK